MTSATEPAGPSATSDPHPGRTAGTTHSAPSTQQVRHHPDTRHARSDREAPGPHAHEESFGDPAPRLIATDLDGTLLRNDKTVSQRTVAALAAAEAAGIEVFFVTGRPARWMGVVAEHLAGHGMAIVANGAAVHDLRAGTLIEAFPLPEPEALAIALALRAAVPGTTFAVERAAGYRHEPGYEALEPDGPAPRAPVEQLLAEDRATPVLKLLARHPRLDPDDFLATALAVAGRHGEITRSSDTALLEISGAGVSKATTLAKCCAERGVTAAEVVAFGDMPNDMAMLGWAGAGYAVANAHPHVLAATRRHTASNQEDGVARVIERIIAAR